MPTVLRRNQPLGFPRMDGADNSDTLWRFPVRSDAREEVRIWLSTRDFVPPTAGALVRRGTALTAPVRPLMKDMMRFPLSDTIAGYVVSFDDDDNSLLPDEADPRRHAHPRLRRPGLPPGDGHHLAAGIWAGQRLPAHWDG